MSPAGRFPVGEWVRHGRTELGAGRYAAAVSGGVHAVRHAGPASPAEQAAVAAVLGPALVLGPAPADHAAVLCRELLDRLPDGPAPLRHALAVLSAMRGDHGAAGRLLADPCRDAAETMAAATLAALAGEWALAEERLRAALGLGVADASRALARVLVGQDRIGEADELLGPSHRTSDPAALADACGLAARILAAGGPPRRAQALADLAVRVAAATDSTCAQGLALLDQAHTLRRLGEHGRAEEAAGQARRRFVEKGHRVGRWHVDVLLTRPLARR